MKLSIFSKFFQYPPCNIWLILGPSGAGKSHFSRFLAGYKNLLHLEVDQFSIEGLGSHDKRGIDIHNLKWEWILFYRIKRGKPLVKEIIRRYERAKREGAILSFPSTIILSSTRIRALPQGVKVIYLFGERQFCANSFLHRERGLRRAIGLRDWEHYNNSIYAALEDPALRPYAVDVFNQDGTHKAPATIYDQIMKDIYGV